MVREDAGLGRFWAAGAWAISAKIRHQARRRRVGYRLMLMHPSGDDLNLLARLVDAPSPTSNRATPRARS